MLEPLEVLLLLVHVAEEGLAAGGLLRHRLLLVRSEGAACVQCAVCSVQCAVYSVQCAVCSVQCTVSSVQCRVNQGHENLWSQVSAISDTAVA